MNYRRLLRARQQHAGRREADGRLFRSGGAEAGQHSEAGAAGYSDEDIFWGYHFVTGALMNTLARTGRIDRLSGGVCHSDDFPAVKKRMAKFMAAGFLALRDR